MIKESSFISSGERSFSPASQQALELTRPPSQWVLGSLSPMSLGHDVSLSTGKALAFCNHSFSTSTEALNGGDQYCSIPFQMKGITDFQFAPYTYYKNSAYQYIVLGWRQTGCKAVSLKVWHHGTSDCNKTGSRVARTSLPYLYPSEVC
jgi:hypothetical protein